MMNDELFSESCAVYEIMWENMGETDRPQTCARCMLNNLGYKHTHTQNMSYLLLFHGNSGYASVSQCYVYTYVACVVFYDAVCQLVYQVASDVLVIICIVGQYQCDMTT